MVRFKTIFVWCDNNTQTIPNKCALAKIGNTQAGLETFNQQPCSPESRGPAIPLYLQKYCFLLKLYHFSQKRSLQQSHFWAVNTLLFGLQEVVPPSTGTEAVKGATGQANIDLCMEVS